MEGGCRAVQRVRQSHPECTGYLCFSDVLAMGALFEAQRQGLSIPRDVSIMGMEGLPLTEHLSPSLTTIDLSVYEMGVGTAEALARWVNEGVRPADQAGLDRSGAGSTLSRPAASADRPTMTAAVASINPRPPT